MYGWLSIREISDIVGAKEDTISKGVRRGKFTKIRQQKVTGKGARGGQMWQVHITDPAISEEHRKAWFLSRLPGDEAAEKLPAKRPDTAVAVVEKPAVPAVGTLKKWQVDTMDARLYFMRLIEQAESTGIGVTRAIRTVVDKAQNGQLPAEAGDMVAKANQRSGSDTGKRTLSERTLMRWWSDWKAAGKQAGAVAPKAVEKEELPPWALYFLQVYRVPQKISVAQALEDLAAVLPEAIEPPSEHQVRRFIAKYSKLDLQRGRMTGKELKSLKGFTRRDTSNLEPLDVCLCDGHSFKAKIAHPVHGRPFLPEVCAVIDAATKVVIGWSAGLAESSQTVADAYRHAVTVNDQKRYGGIPAILYTDKGAGNEAKVNSDPFTGMYARVGSTYKTGIPGNSQARGLIERAQQSLWIRAAKKLITYSGKGMDGQVQRKVYLRLEKDVKAAVKAGNGGKKSELLMGWQDFLDFCAAQVEEYNRRPHTSLPRITDQSGQRRHMCPLEMWAKFLGDGWAPTVPDAGELDHLFRPHVTVTTRRGEVRLFGNIYYSGDLVHYNGQTVIVAYDIHDASQVWVKDQDERLITVARFEANKRDFYPRSATDQARDERLNRRKKLKELQIAEIEAEARPAIETAPLHVELPREVIAFEARQQVKEAQKQIAGRYYDNIADLYDDIKIRSTRGEASAYELTWADDYDRSLSSGKRLGLYKTDPTCSGGAKESAAQGE